MPPHWTPLTLLLLVVVVTPKVLAQVEFLDNNDDNDLQDVSMRNPKFFPFFSIIRFKNSECSGRTSLNGTCFTRRECNDLGGTSFGSCASKRGVCCIIQRTCGSNTNVNNTYFTNVGYPASTTGGARCSIIVNRCNSEICQLRLEFLDLVLAQPNGDGSCVRDALVVSGGSSEVPRICGDNTGHHVYVNFNGDNPITISVDASLGLTFNRRWNIKLTQIPCNCITLAPTGCLMYFTGTSGTVNSFNFGTMPNQAIATSGLSGTREIANLNYGVCIRMEAGFCQISWSQSSSSGLSFTLTGDVPGADATVLGNPAGGITGIDCTTDFVIIPNPTDSTTGAALNVDRFCGLGFSPVTTASKPFVLTVVTDANEGQMPSPDNGNRGFSLNYAQQACGV